MRRSGGDKLHTHSFCLDSFSGLQQSTLESTTLAIDNSSRVVLLYCIERAAAMTTVHDDSSVHMVLTVLTALGPTLRADFAHTVGLNLLR